MNKVDFLVRPHCQQLLIQMDPFNPLDPLCWVDRLQLGLGLYLDLDSVSSGVKLQRHLCCVFASDVKLQDATTLHSCSQQHILVFVKNTLVHEASLGSTRVDADHIFVEHVDFEVGAHHKIQHFGLAVAHGTYVVRLCFFVEINSENSFSSKFIPNVNLLVVITDESSGVGIIKTTLHRLLHVVAN